MGFVPESEVERIVQKRLDKERLKNISPDDAKYWGASSDLAPFLSADAEWHACALVQKALLETRVELGQDQHHLDAVTEALERISAVEMARIEKEVTKHDQLAVIEEIGNHVPPETKALLHPGTTSYDILDTARSYLFKGAWSEVIRPQVVEVIMKLADIAERSIDMLQVGRTHLQDTSPTTFGLYVSNFAARLSERVDNCDEVFSDLRGKISGIVGTGASVDIVTGDALAFEQKVLEKLDLQPDHTATQIVQKERLVDAGNSLVTLMGVLANFADDMRLLYSSAIGEVTSRSNAERLGGSSADAGKNNPINWENIAGKYAVVRSGMVVLYEMMTTNLQRDLRSSVQARYQPQQMMVGVYESFCRASRALDQLSVNEDVLERNLMPVRNSPTEAMTAITRAHGWIHSELGVGHDAVKAFAKKAKQEGMYLVGVAMQDLEFNEFYESLPKTEQEILDGKLEKYLGPAREKTLSNIDYARDT